tara:strand:- start:430 stop:624 length:195 start_codon:yes stop_codon:yes gene_type:complete
MPLVYTKRQENLDRLSNLQEELQCTYDDLVRAMHNVDGLRELVLDLSDMVQDAQIAVNLDKMEF